MLWTVFLFLMFGTPILLVLSMFVPALRILLMPVAMLWIAGLVIVGASTDGVVVAILANILLTFAFAGFAVFWVVINIGMIFTGREPFPWSMMAEHMNYVPIF
jgi:hypothetical protein